MPRNFEDLTGKRFGRLLVLKRDKNYILKNRTKGVRWLCKCDCNNEIIVSASSLKKGSTTSCGCYKIESIRKRCKKYNKYDLFDNFGVGYLNNNKIFLFDIEDFDKIYNYKWYENPEGYIKTSIKIKGINRHLTLSRIIMNIQDEKIIVDHINHKIYDNRKNNLRIATSSENNMNKCKSPLNKSGCIGVCWSKKREKWVAYINVNYKHIFLGYFNNIEDAIRARKEAEIKYFGEFAYKG